MDPRSQMCQPLLDMLNRVPQVAMLGSDAPPPMPASMYDDIVRQLRQQFLWLGYIEDITMEQLAERLASDELKKLQTERDAAAAVASAPR